MLDFRICTLCWPQFARFWRSLSSLLGLNRGLSRIHLLVSWWSIRFIAAAGNARGGQRKSSLLQRSQAFHPKSRDESPPFYKENDFVKNASFRFNHDDLWLFGNSQIITFM
jgi:hypothetical protein